MSRFQKTATDFEVNVDKNHNDNNENTRSNPQRHHQDVTASTIGSINFDDHNEPYVPSSRRRPSGSTPSAIPTFYDDETEDEDESSPVLSTPGRNRSHFSAGSSSSNAAAAAAAAASTSTLGDLHGRNVFNSEDDDSVELATRRRWGYLGELREDRGDGGSGGSLFSSCCQIIKESWKGACLFFFVVAVTTIMFLTISLSAGDGMKNDQESPYNKSHYNHTSFLDDNDDPLFDFDNILEENRALFDSNICDEEAQKVLTRFVYRVFSGSSKFKADSNKRLHHLLRNRFIFCTFKDVNNEHSKNLKKDAGWHPSKDDHDHSGYHSRIKGNKDAFSVESIVNNNNNNLIIIKISSTTRVAAAKGFYWYLKHVLNSQVTWGADQLDQFLEELEKKKNSLEAGGNLPPVTNKVSILSTVPWRHAWNMVTFGYTSVWWDWERWERELDWMALHGINLPLAFVGQEYVWIQAFAQYGIQPEEMERWFAGPAFLPWQRGGNLMGFAGPLPMQWIMDQRDLQRKILKRMRDFSMTPVLPCFAGHVPAAAEKVWKDGHYQKPANSWNHFPAQFADVLMIDPNDKAFHDISAAFMKAQDQVYNNSGYYSCDTFNENKPLSDSEEYLSGASNAVVKGITQTDPNGVWLMQAWLFSPGHDDFSFWRQPQVVERYLKGADRDHFIILDLHAEDGSLSLYFNNFYGKASIWCLLHNYGGVRGMYGDLNRVAKGPFDDMKKDKESVATQHNGELKDYFVDVTTSVLGMGFVPESIEQNPIVYELMTENFFKAPPSTSSSDHEDLYTSSPKFNLVNWVKWYLSQRYVNGISPSSLAIVPSSPSNNNNKLADLYHEIGDSSSSSSSTSNIMKQTWQCWKRLLSTLYASEKTPRTELENVPMFRGDLGTWKADAQPADMFFAFDQLLEAVNSKEVDPERSAGLHYDAVDIARQAATMFFTDVHVMWLTVGNDLSTNEQKNSFSELSRYLLDLISRLDDVLGTDKNYLLGVWLNGAKKAASTVKKAAERTEIEKLFRYNAKNQITMWGPQSQIPDYAAKAWSGLYNDYYRKRYEVAETYIESVGGVKNANPIERDNKLLKFEKEWNNKTDDEDRYPTTASGKTWKHTANMLMEHIAASKDDLIQLFEKHNSGISSSPNYDLYQGYSRMPLWTHEPRELARLCLIIQSCTAFTSTGYLLTKSDVPVSTSNAGADLYVKRK